MSELKFRPIPDYTPEQRARIASLFTEGSPESCWEWRGAHTPDGYGLYNDLLAHRVVYALHFGKDISEICILHTCDHPPCVNPWHMFEGTKGDNNRDRHQKGRTHLPSKRARGIDNANAKLTDDRVREIRQHFANGITMKAIARMYAVSHPVIEWVVKGRSWKHVK